MAAGGEFVEGWLVAQVLGEGAYGEVRLLVHARSGARVALKAVGGDAGRGAREAALHGALRHPNVLRCLGARAHPPSGAHYLFLEWAEGGELFERIEPDAGMPVSAARRYWRQLAAGLRYLHARGVAHRDIKPENLLLTARDILKISDFGMATLFRHGSRERLLSRVCGTLPYAAPEVHSAPARPYRAAPADTWAAAIVMLAMLLGELPWERAHAADTRYAAWARGDTAGGVWARLKGGASGRVGALQWFQRALRPEPQRRAPLADLLLDRWMNDSPPAPVGERGCLSQPAGAGGEESGSERGEYDEPDGVGEGAGAGVGLRAADMDAMLSCSQPATTDLLLLSPDHLGATYCPQPDTASGAAEGAMRRLARVWVRGGEGDAVRAVAAAAEARSWAVRRLGPRALRLDTGDGVALRAVVAAASGGAATLLQCSRAKGCGLQFQRRFRELCDALQPHIVLPPPLASRPLAAPMDQDPS